MADRDESTKVGRFFVKHVGAHIILAPRLDLLVNGSNCLGQNFLSFVDVLFAFSGHSRFHVGLLEFQNRKEQKRQPT